MSAARDWHQPGSPVGDGDGRTSPSLTVASRSDTTESSCGIASRVSTRGLVLLAEDDPANQRLATAILEWGGFRVDCAGTGVDAVEAVRSRPYGAVLMDCQMPKMDGYDAARRIRAYESDGRRTPIVAITSDRTAGERQRCLGAGMDDYLPKPFRRDDLLRVVARWVGEDVSVLAASSRNATRVGSPHRKGAGQPSPRPDQEGFVGSYPSVAAATPAADAPR